MISFDHELEQYIGTAIWSSTVEVSEDGETKPMDVDYSSEDFTPETTAQMHEDLSHFLLGPACHEDATDEAIAAHEAALQFWVDQLGQGQIGHDFWLTRNGHGAGFWDRFSGDQLGARYGQYLTEQAKSFGSSDLYIGDDNRIHIS